MLLVFLVPGIIFPVWFSVSEKDRLLLVLLLEWFLQSLVHWWLGCCWCLGWHFSGALKPLEQMTVNCLLGMARLMTAFMILTYFLCWYFKFSFEILGYSTILTNVCMFHFQLIFWLLISVWRWALFCYELNRFFGWIPCIWILLKLLDSSRVTIVKCAIIHQDFRHVLLACVTAIRIVGGHWRCSEIDSSIGLKREILIFQ